MQSSFSFLIFLALILHKAPETFSISTFLLHENCVSTTIYKCMAVLSLVTPIAGVLAYAVLSAMSSGKDKDTENYRLLAICLLLSAGSFLYVATMHVMPEVYLKTHVHDHGHEEEMEKKCEEKSEGGSWRDMALVFAGAITPFFLTVFLDED